MIRSFMRLKPGLEKVAIDALSPEMIEVVCGYCYQPSDVCGGRCPESMLEVWQIERDIALRKLKDDNGGMLIF